MPTSSETDPGDGGEPSGASALLARVKDSRPVRAFQRYSAARGGLLAGGIAYTALFSIVAALTIAWTVFMATLGGNETLREQVVEAVNSVLPGILADSSGQGMVDPDSLVLDTALNPASIVAAFVLLWSATGLMTSIRSTVQAMFGIVAPTENVALAKLRDLLGFVAMAVGIVASALLGTAASSMGAVVMDALGLGDNAVVGFLLRAAGLLVAAALSMLTFAFLFRVTAAVRPLARDLWLGSAVGGVAVQVVLFAGTALVSSVADNPLLAASASLATLLLFVNLLSRVLLVVAAFTADPPAPQRPESPQEVHFRETPNFVTRSAPHTLGWEYQDVTGEVGVDERLRPGFRRPRPGDLNPIPTDVRPDGLPIDDDEIGPVARMRLARKARRYERAAVETRARLGQRPRIDAAETAFWKRRGVRGRLRRR